ncbi:MAG: Gfo/Idh/MocA family oxidoreductase [Clostridiales bacterium]|jgi:predicted dehydrogenase|nr:Gfo/Idh/MocA family oxidoreductase [Clostridiales bacterium]
MERVKIGIIGAGMAWEKLHHPAFQRLADQFSIEAICDKNMEKARNAAHMAGLGPERAYDSYQIMLNSVEVDAVDILVPIEETYEVARDVLGHKKHLIVEKPVAATLSGAKELAKLCKKVKMLVAENYRYNEENKIIKNLIDEKAIGSPIQFLDVNMSDFQQEKQSKSEFASTEWRQHPDFKGGIFLDSGVHHMARSRFLFGDIVKVYAVGRKAPKGFSQSPYSCINAMITFKNGICGQYSYCCVSNETQMPPVGLRIYGTQGEIFLEDKECGFVNFTTKNGDHQAIPYKPNEGYFNELINFYEAIENDAPIVATPEKGCGDIQIIFDILKSIETESAIEYSVKRASREAAK